MILDSARDTVPAQATPMGRFIEVDELAGTVSYLLSDAARSVTGQQLLICGGASL